MLRQFHIFHKGEPIYNFTYAMALGDEELENVKKTIKSYLEIPTPGKTVQKPLGEYQIFHRGIGASLFLLVTDLVDTLEQIDGIIDKIIDKYKKTYSDPLLIKKQDSILSEFESFLREIQYELHSKICIIGPISSGKTQLYTLLRGNGEKNILSFAKSSIFQIDQLRFDIWDFQLKDNFSLLWAKFISGADLTLLLFDLSNYHLRVINHFLDLYRKEAKLSKLLIIGTKRDLVQDMDLKIIKNELGLPEFKDISLLDTDAKKKLIQIISSALKLKISLPSNFEILRKEAERLKNQGNFILAIAKYKELINICNAYQDFKFIASFKQDLEELQKKVEKEKRIRKQIDSKKKFEVPGQIKFTDKITVQPLPKDKTKILPKIIPNIEIPKKEFEESKTEETKIGKLTLFKSSKEKLRPEKDVLKPEDIKIELKGPSTEPTSISPKVKSSGVQFPRQLQTIIEKKGGSLSLKLCEHLVSELETTLGRPLTIEDIETAANIFIKQENL
ncbi:MAG: Rab family GTPase [Promethearchaeota archaeon]